MFSTSGDILNIVLAISIVVLVFFLCWVIYYLVIATHKFYRIAKRAEKGVIKAEEIIDTVQDKIKSSTPYMMMFSEFVKQAFTFVKEKKDKKKVQSRSKNRSKK